MGVAYGWFWIIVSHEIAVKMWDWGWRICSWDASHTWQEDLSRALLESLIAWQLASPRMIQVFRDLALEITYHHFCLIYRSHRPALTQCWKRLHKACIPEGEDLWGWPYWESLPEWQLVMCHIPQLCWTEKKGWGPTGALLAQSRWPK